jgi:sigma-B regulation protein RsbU (phosphoserine phosphatase)
MNRILKVIDPSGVERIFIIANDLVRIGRASDNDVVLDDPCLSREHAQIDREGKAHFITDLKSRNGTWLNESPIRERMKLNSGDQVKLGNTTLIFQNPEEQVSVRLRDEKPFPTDTSLVVPAESLLTDELAACAPGTRCALIQVAKATRILIREEVGEEFYTDILGSAIEAVQAERGAILALDDNPPRLVPKATKITVGGDRLSISQTIAQMTQEGKKSILTTDALFDPRFEMSASVRLEGIRSAMCVPLVHEKTTQGVIYVDRLLSKKEFSRRDLALLTIIGNLTAAKLENLILQREAEEKKKLEKEVALARDIQQRLLPFEPPELRGYECIGASYPCRDVGGDFFDYIKRGEGRMGFAIGDVSGKGISAALLMANVQASLRAFLKAEGSLGAVFRKINEALFESTAPNRFVTLFYAELDPGTGEGIFFNAGHNPAVLLKGSEVRQLYEGSCILGSFPALRECNIGAFRMDPGDLLFMYTDGVVEAADREDNLFGQERLLKLLKAEKEAGVAELHEAIFHALTDFTGSAHLADDTTFIALQRHKS